MPRSNASAGTKTRTKTKPKAKAKNRSTGGGAVAAAVESHRSSGSNRSNRSNGFSGSSGSSGSSGKPEAAGDKPIGHEQIALRAYEIWLEQGRPSGQRERHWFEAERQIRATGRDKSPQAL